MREVAREIGDEFGVQTIGVAADVSDGSAIERTCGWLRVTTEPCDGCQATNRGPAAMESGEAIVSAPQCRIGIMDTVSSLVHRRIP